MKNAILPSVSSQLHSFGSMSQSISEVPAQIDGTLNFYGNSFNFMDSNLYNNQYDFAIPPQFPMDYQSGLSTIMTMKRLDCPYVDGAVGYPTCTSTTIDDMDDPVQQPLPFTKKLSVPLHLNDTDEAIKNPRKRPIEATREDSKIRVSNNKNIVVNQYWKKTNKKMAHQEPQQPSQDMKQEALHQIPIPRRKAPVRRSQKLSDKITALQKLVSPYGKTDTASVLEEASISINLLQHQIQNLFNKLSYSSINTEPIQYQGTEEKLGDLRNRGMCLVPVSFTQRLTEPDRFTQRPMSRNHAMPRNF